MRLPIAALFDDFVFVAIAKRPEELVTQCRRVFKNIGTAFTSRGMHVNDKLEEQKNEQKEELTTEALLTFHGSGAGKARAHVNPGSQTITARSPMFGQLEIGITDQYKHLGSVNAGPTSTIRKLKQE